MMKKLIALVTMIGLPWLLNAQSNNDLYFFPKQEKKTAKKVEKTVVRPNTSSSSYTTNTSSSSYTTNTSSTSYTYPGASTGVVVRDVNGKVRDVDEYNRCYTSRDNKFSIEGNNIYIDEKPYSERGEWVNGFQGSQMDYEYATRIVRFRNPRFAIHVSSPLYWDVVYGALPSWDWNVYDDGVYAYVFPTSYNRLYWDWNFSSGFYGPRWGMSWRWGSPWYSTSWYYYPWYGPSWSFSYHYGYYGPHWHHYYNYRPYYGYNGYYRSGRTDYRAGRYGNRGSYSSSSHVRRSGSASPSYTRTGTPSYTRTHGTTTSRRPEGTPIRRSSSIGRVVDRSNTTTGSSSSVRPSRPSRNSGSSTSTTYPGRRPVNSYTRPSSTVDRSGSSYNRPSSTRRSSSYTRRPESSSRSENYNGTSGRINRGNSHSSYSRSSSSSYSRSSSSSRSSGHSGSVRRR